MREFEKTVSEEAADPDATRATAQLPGLNIEIVHRRAAEDDAEQISIHLRAMPSFEAFGHMLQFANPFAIWMHGAQLVWLSWFQTARTLALAWPLTPSLPRPSADAASHRPQNGA